MSAVIQRVKRLNYSKRYCVDAINLFRAPTFRSPRICAYIANENMLYAPYKGHSRHIASGLRQHHFAFYLDGGDGGGGAHCTQTHTHSARGT